MDALSSRAFAQSFALKPESFAWLLGAGASATAGIPTGYRMIEDFRRQLYERLVSATADPAVGNGPLSDVLVDARLAEAGIPARGDPTEYSVLFEKLFPDAAERRRYIDRQVKLGSPSAGHRVLGSLLATRKTPCVFTTNFDQLIERAAIVAGEKLDHTARAHATVAAIDNAERAQRCVKESDWPLIAKLHGDFQSTALMNTGDELRSQDARMRDVLREACNRFGLIVVGYSGRDESVMAALESCVESWGSRAFPMGLYWVTRDPGDLLPAVVRLLECARVAKIKAEVVRCSGFDTLAQDLANCVELPEALKASIPGDVPRPVPAADESRPAPVASPTRPHSPAWWRRHVRAIAGIAGSVALTVLGIAFSIYQASSVRQAKWDGLYDVIAKRPESDRLEMIRSIVSVENAMVAQAARDDSSNLQEDLALAKRWHDVASSAIAIWRPLSDCVRVGECEPGRTGPEACQRAATLSIAVGRNNLRLQSMGQLANLGMGGERPPLPPIDVLDVLLGKACAQASAQRDAVQAVAASTRNKRVEAAQAEWKEVEASDDLQRFRLFRARFIDVLAEVPGPKALESLETRLDEAGFARRKKDLGAAICALANGAKGALEGMRSIQRPKPMRCDSAGGSASCSWSGFYPGIRGETYSAREDAVIDILSQVVTGCFPSNSLKVESSSPRDWNDPVGGRSCTMLTRQFVHASGVRIQTQACGQWVELVVQRADQLIADAQAHPEQR